MPHVRRAFAVCTLCALFLLTAVGAHAQLHGVKADVNTVADAARPGAGVETALVATLPDGFHVQSNKPRDPNLIPTVLTIDPPPGVTVAEIVYPPAVDAKLVGSDQPLAVFERNFAIGVRFDLAASVKPGDVTIPARLRYQSCNETTCFAPSTAQFQWTLHVGGAADPGAAAVLGKIAWGHGERPAAGTSTPGTSTGTSAPGPGTSAPGTSTGTSAPGTSAPSTSNPQSLIPSPSPARVDLSALDRFEVAGTTGGYQGSSDFLQFIHDAEAGVKQQGMFEGRGPLAILLLVLLGGLALNLTPCVLPMIPINLAIIGAGAKAGSRGRGFMLGAVYGGAMAVVYGVLGLVVVLTASTFGTINASPWFNLAIAILFVVLALAMFDVLIIDFSKWSTSFNPTASRGSVVLAFSMGAVAALLAGACVAPVVIQVVLFSSNLYATGTKVALALPFILGIGMAIPWPIAGAGLASLPKPGMWMVRVKQVFGVLILATAVYYGYEAYSIFSNRWVDSGAVASSVQEKLKEGWQSSLDAGLATAAREQKPVLIDFWATWCKNCLTMDKTTMEDPRVEAALEHYVKVKFQAEDPDAQPAKAVMERFRAVGLPTYVILKPKRASN